jgi:hypothetical protein
MYSNPASMADVTGFKPRVEKALVAIDTSLIPIQRTRIIPELRIVLWSAKQGKWAWKFQVAVDGSRVWLHAAKVRTGRVNEVRGMSESDLPERLVYVSRRNATKGIAEFYEARHQALLDGGYPGTGSGTWRPDALWSQEARCEDRL